MNSLFFKAMVLGSFCFGTYALARSFFGLARSSLASFRSYFNPTRYLTSSNTETKTRHYAVVYGACNRAGKAYAHYLARKGFSLILIDRALDSLERVRAEI